MAPVKIYYRFWCKQCQDFTLQNTGEDESCRICGTITESYNLNEVPHEKLIEQQNRYRKMKMERFASILNVFEPVFDILSDMDEAYKPRIIECDAGYKQIEEERTQKRKERELQKELLQKEKKEKFSGINRNDICPCGSGKKYKKCCQSKFKNV